MAKHVQTPTGTKEDIVYILAVADKHRNQVRMLTESFDELRKMAKRYNDRDIFYVAKRRGKRKRDIAAVAVYSDRMGGLACPSDLAVKRLAMEKFPEKPPLKKRIINAIVDFWHRITLSFYE